MTQRKVILILSGKTAFWKYVRIGLEREICIVDKILRYGVISKICCFWQVQALAVEAVLYFETTFITEN